MTIADVLSLYAVKMVERFDGDGDANPAKERQKAEFLRRMEKLNDYWGAKKVSAIGRKACRDFAKGFGQVSAKRMLEDLRAAVRDAIGDEELAPCEIQWEIPPAPDPRYRFFTRSQFARFIWRAFRFQQGYTYGGARAREETRGTSKKTRAYTRRHIVRMAMVGAQTGTRKDRLERASFFPEPGRPWIDCDGGIFYRSWHGERVPGNKRADPVPLPERLRLHCLRWRDKLGLRYLCERPSGEEEQDDAGNTAGAFRRAVADAFPDEADRKGYSIHTLKHTCATWACMAGDPLAEIAVYLSTSERIIDKHYGHHHPDHARAVADSFSSGRAGRLRKPGLKASSAGPSPAVSAETRSGIRDLLDVAGAPFIAFSLLDETPDKGLPVLKERVKRAARERSWAELLGVPETA